jgi:hypothetical protein
MFQVEESERDVLDRKILVYLKYVREHNVCRNGDSDCDSDDSSDCDSDDSSDYDSDDSTDSECLIPMEIDSNRITEIVRDRCGVDLCLNGVGILVPTKDQLNQLHS